MVKKRIKPRFYIAHTFSERADVLELISKLQRLGIETLNPFYDKKGGWKPSRPEVKIADEMRDRGIKAGEAAEWLRQVKTKSENIVDTDLDLIHDVDGIIAYMPEGSAGTSIEIFTCGGLFRWLEKRGYEIPPVFTNRKVFLVTKATRVFNHPWLRYACVRIFKTDKALLNYLRREMPRLRQWAKERRKLIA